MLGGQLTQCRAGRFGADPGPRLVGGTGGVQLTLEKRLLVEKLGPPPAFPPPPGR